MTRQSSIARCICKSMQESSEAKKNNKWDFSDYAFVITGIIVGVLLVVPEILASQFDISFLGGSMGDVAPAIIEGLEDGPRGWTLSQLRPFSPFLFLLTTTIVFFKEAIDARKSGGYKGSMFTHTFESLLEEAIYMAITTIMVYGAILYGAMYASWLAGPISWVIFVFIFPLVRKKSGRDDEVRMPWLLLTIFVVGIVAEAVTGAWVAFPLSWLIICAIELVNTIRERDKTIDTVFEIIYYAFSVMLIAVGIVMGFWIISWMAFPIALLICWVISKFGGYKKEGLPR